MHLILIIVLVLFRLVNGGLIVFARRFIRQAVETFRLERALGRLRYRTIELDLYRLQLRRFVDSHLFFFHNTAVLFVKHNCMIIKAILQISD